RARGRARRRRSDDRRTPGRRLPEDRAERFRAPVLSRCALAYEGHGADRAPEGQNSGDRQRRPGGRAAPLLTVPRRAGIGRWLLTLVRVAGCGVGSRALRPARPTTVDELVDGLAARRAAVSSMRARVRLRSGLARVWTHQAVLVQRPTDIRID